MPTRPRSRLRRQPRPRSAAVRGDEPARSSCPARRRRRTRICSVMLDSRRCCGRRTGAVHANGVETSAAPLQRRPRFPGRTARAFDGLLIGTIRVRRARCICSSRRIRTTSPEWADADFDARHRLVVSEIWELPFGANRRWLREGLVAHRGRLVSVWHLHGPVRVSVQRVRRQRSVSACRRLRRRRPNLVSGQSARVRPQCDAGSTPRRSEDCARRVRDDAAQCDPDRRCGVSICRSAAASA